MKGYVGVTDNQWFSFLSEQPGIDEVNFWQPGGGTAFRRLSPGEPFFFKLHSPSNYIAGGGFFAHHSILPVSLAWQAFGLKNGADSLYSMKRLIERRRKISHPFEDYKIGCIILTQPFFFPRDLWIPAPDDFSLNIVQGKSYDLTSGTGRRLWEQVQDRLTHINLDAVQPERIGDPAFEDRYGNPIMILPRLGQGGFRVMVTDAYQRRCAVTHERTLPALEAAHIRPFSEEGPNKVSNGLLLRSDIHRLFDTGYVTVTTDHHFEVSRRVREEFENGRDYYALSGQKIHLPHGPDIRPCPVFLSWHNENVYRG